MDESTTAKSLNRRTVLAGAVWATPVVATAIAVPMASASTGTEVDLTISSSASTDNAANEAGTANRVVQGYLKAVGVRNDLYRDTESPAVLTFSYDTRWYTGIELADRATGAAIAPTGPAQISGNVGTVSFSILVPAWVEGGPSSPDVRFDVNALTVAEKLPYVADLNPFSVVLTPSDADNDPSSQSIHFEVRNEFTWDATVTDATWTTQQVTTGAGAETVYLPLTATVTALAPGDIPPGDLAMNEYQYLTVQLPSHIPSTATITSATVNGVQRNIFGATTSEPGDYQKKFPLLETIPAGTSVVVSFECTVSNSTLSPEEPYKAVSSVGFSAPLRERDVYNNTAHQPG